MTADDLGWPLSPQVLAQSNDALEKKVTKLETKASGAKESLKEAHAEAKEAKRLWEVERRALGADKVELAKKVTKLEKQAASSDDLPDDL
jgi:hypothetical protein